MSYRVKGFTLIELVVVLALLTILAIFSLDGFSGMLDFSARVETNNRLKVWKLAVENVYQKYSTTIDENSGAVFDLGPVHGITAAAVPNSARICSIDSTKIREFARFAGLSAGDLIHDGHHRNFCMFITNRLTDVVGGTSLFYHSIAIVSGGPNGRVEADTTLDANGNLNINPASDDVGILFDGRKFAVDRYNLTLARLNKAADAYAAYYAARYQSDTSRSLAVDYFSCGTEDCSSPIARWDQFGQMPSTCTAPLPIVAETGISPHSVLGLSQSDVTDGWGELFQIDNCTDAVRSPSNTAVNKQIPPYTAVISSTLPGGAILSVTAVGQI